jgi:hypothetical protein
MLYLFDFVIEKDAAVAAEFIGFTIDITFAAAIMHYTA